MLVLSRKKNESIVIGGCITVTVVDIRGDKVRLGIDAPRDIPVHREEIAKAIEKEQGHIEVPLHKINQKRNEQNAESSS